MTLVELFKLWAPEDSIWSPWAKPVLFAASTYTDIGPDETPGWQVLNVDWAPAPSSGAAIILDLQGADGVWYAMALGQRGYRPVPLYNGVPGPMLSTRSLVNVNPIVEALHSVADALSALKLQPDSPPVFLLDSDRLAGGEVAEPGNFDNRWSVFPQDFPSANLLLNHGIRTAVLAQPYQGVPSADLAHVLLRWQQAGIEILSAAAGEPAKPKPITVEKPARFRSLAYCAMVLAGLRRNSTGGFGALAPDPNSGSGYG